ncbi:LuxR C-terminal-related transcriptional regulator, partial [Promineifilum sp.]|uniref:LuxR C-terminal-related transcriptional regulator n=1 Tax=Promineifilum sp. TaxID=2664178 RepID=UPI0035AD8E3B
PVLCNLFGGALLQTGELEGVETWLSAAETWLEPPADLPMPPDARPSRMVVVNEEEFRRLPGAIAIHRAGQALMLGKVADTIQHARRALELAPEDDYLVRGGATALLGLACWTSGDLEAARQLYAEGMPLLQRAGNISDVMGCALALADIHIAQGRLRDAMRIYERALQLAADQGMPAMRGTADMLVGLSELYRERNDLPAAAHYLERSKAQGEHTGLPQSRYRWYAAMAGIRQAEGDLNGALDLLNEADQRYMSDFSPNVRPIAARKARLWVDQGRLEQALDWANAQGLSTEDPLNYLREYEHMTLARVRLAQHRRDTSDSAVREAIELLESLLYAAEKGGRTGSVIELLILQALAFQGMAQPGLDNLAAALASLERALRLAEPEGYIRLFIDEGPPMAQLLREAARREILPEYTATLLGAFQAEPLARASGESRAASPAKVAPAKSTTGVLVEPLSERELDVLRLFDTDLSGPEIAGELVIALSTVRTHTKSIYSKLNVNNRRAAVKRAAELGLL